MLSHPYFYTIFLKESYGIPQVADFYALVLHIKATNCINPPPIVLFLYYTKRKKISGIKLD